MLTFLRPQDHAKDGELLGSAGRAAPRARLRFQDEEGNLLPARKNVYSAEVEDAIASRPDVEQLAVISIPHETWGEAVPVILVPRSKAEPTEEAITEHARQPITGYSIPTSVEFRDQLLPLSGAMTILERELRRPYREDQERRIRLIGRRNRRRRRHPASRIRVPACA